MPPTPKPPPTVGTVFGRWTVMSDEIQFRYHGKKSHRFLRVQCRCGNRNWVAISRLTGGYSLSCGCIRKEKHTAILKRGAPLPTSFEA